MVERTQIVKTDDLAPSPAALCLSPLGVMGRPLANLTRLSAIKLELLEIVTQPAAAGKPGAVNRHKVLIGDSRPTLRLLSDFPAQGRSGEAAQYPLLQFCPPSLTDPLKAVGVRNLQDLLVRSLCPEGRKLLAEVCGVPRAVLLLAAMRAEVLDLPPLDHKYARPHIKDAILLSRLGVASRPALARLAELFDAQPARIEIMARLLTALQRHRPAEYLGRQRISKIELRAWGLAAQKHGSDLQLNAVSASDADSAGERVLSWYVTERSADREGLWHEIVARAYDLLLASGHWPEDKVHQLIMAECAVRTREVVGRLQAEGSARSGPAHEDLQQREAQEALARAERARFAQYMWSEAGADLFTDLLPWLAPATAPVPGLICFRLQPMPFERAQLALADDSPRFGPQDLALEPQSGVVAPLRRK